MPVQCPLYSPRGPALQPHSLAGMCTSLGAGVPWKSAKGRGITPRVSMDATFSPLWTQADRDERRQSGGSGESGRGVAGRKKDGVGTRGRPAVCAIMARA